MAVKVSNSARRLSELSIGTIAVLVSLFGVVGSASATTTTSTSVRPSCSLDLGTGDLTCVANGQNLDAAVLKEHGLRVVAPSGARGGPDATLLLDSPQTTYVQSQLYDDVSYGGSFFQITNSNQCNGSTVYVLSNLGNYGWSGRVSSFKSFSNCSTKVWQGTNETGASYGYDVDASSLGSMNDLANSASMK